MSCHPSTMAIWLTMATHIPGFLKISWAILLVFVGVCVYICIYVSVDIFVCICHVCCHLPHAFLITLLRPQSVTRPFLPLRPEGLRAGELKCWCPDLLWQPDGLTAGGKEPGIRHKRSRSALSSLVLGHWRGRLQKGRLQLAATGHEGRAMRQVGRVKIFPDEDAPAFALWGNTSWFGCLI